MHEVIEACDRQSRVLQVILVYALFAAAWILFSDVAVNRLVRDPEVKGLVSILKGWLFVGITTLLLHGLLTRANRAATAAPEPAVPALAAGLAPWTPWARYLFAVLASIAMLLVRAQISPGGTERSIFIILDFPIILSAALGGLGPGLCATLLVAAGAWVFPRSDLANASSSDVMHWSFLLVNGALVSILAGLLQVAWRRATLSMAQRLDDLRLMAAIADSSNDAIFAKDLEGRYIFFNRAASEFVGKPAAEVLGHDDRTIFPERQAEQLMAAGRRVLRENAIITAEEHLETARGNRIFLATKGPIRDDRGEAIALFGISRDITNLKQAEQALVESEARYRSLFLNSPDPVLVNENGRIVLVNASCLQLFGASRPEQLIGKSIYELFYPDHRQAIESRIEAVLTTDESLIPFEENIRRLDGRSVPVDVAAAPFRHGQDAAIHVILRDISLRKRTEESLRQQAEELAQRNQELERFNQAAVGRELAMIALKQQVNRLSRELGRPPAYPLEFLESGEACG